MPEMKDSGIEWIGEIPVDFSVSRIKYISGIFGRIGFRGYTQDDLVGEGEGAITLSPSNFKNMKMNFDKCSFISWDKYYESPEIMINPKDILFVKTGSSYGKSCYVNKLPLECTINPQLIVFKNVKGNSKWFSYYLQTDFIKTQSELAVVGGTIPTMSQEKIGNFPVIVPPIEQQNKIVSFLDSKCAEIDALIADTQSEIETLEEYKKSFITEAVTKGLNPNVPMKDSSVQWIGMMPEHWECIKGKYVLKYLQKPVREDDGVITCFRDGEVTLRSNRREDGFTMSDKEIGYQGIDVGDLVVHGMDGFAGSIGISDSRGKASPVLNVLDTDMDKKYVMYYLRSMAYSDVFLALATGIRVRSCDLRWNKLAELLYPVPPLDEQIKISAHIDDTLEEANAVIAIKKKQLETLEEYKKSVIYEYVTGKKEVPLS